MGEIDEFVRQYDRQIVGLPRREFFAGNDYYNVGYWTPGTLTQTEACRNLVAKLAAMLPENAGSVLDVACGLGATTRQLHRLLPGSTVTGIDLSLQQVARARQVTRSTRFCRMDAARIAFADESFDNVICVEAMFHFNTPADFLRQAHRILKPGGHLVVSDILFTNTSWIGDWMVPGGNLGSGLRAYLATFRQTGFGDVRWTDATDACWRSFCRQMRRQAAAGHAEGRLTEGDYRAQIRRIEGLEQDCVDRYLLVRAGKPAGPSEAT